MHTPAYAVYARSWVGHGRQRVERLGLRICAADSGWGASIIPSCHCEGAGMHPRLSPTHSATRAGDEAGHAQPLTGVKIGCRRIAAPCSSKVARTVDGGILVEIYGNQWSDSSHRASGDGRLAAAIIYCGKRRVVDSERICPATWCLISTGARYICTRIYHWYKGDKRVQGKRQMANFTS